MIEAARSLVPPRSQILEVSDNGNGLTMIEGDYWADIRIDDGGLGAGLPGALEQQAAAEGWEERYRCERLSGVGLGYVKDDYKVDVSAHTNKEPIEGRIRIQRLGDGSPWPPAC